MGEGGRQPDRTPSWSFSPPATPSLRPRSSLSTAKGPFSLEATYAEPALLPTGTNPWVGKLTVKNVEKPASGDLACVKVKARLNLHGIMNFESAYMVEEIEKEEIVTIGEGEEKTEEKKMVKKIQRKATARSSASTPLCLSRLSSRLPSRGQDARRGQARP